jgi:hypothetical protein
MFEARVIHQFLKDAAGEPAGLFLVVTGKSMKFRLP